MSNTFSVAIQRCTTYQADAVQAAVEQAVNLLGGMRAFVKPGGLVLIKPNLLFARPPEAAVTTHPAVVEAVARLALDCGGRVVIGDSPPLASAKRVAEMAGIADVARRWNLTVVDLNRPAPGHRRPPARTASAASPSLDRTVLEADVVINVPKLKAHQQMFLTCGVKNLFGCVKGRRKAYWHFKLRHGPDLFAEMLLALYERIASELTIVDAVIGMEGMGPGSGTPKPIGLILAGGDALAVDRAVTDILPLNWRDHYVIRAARQRGFPAAELESLHFPGLTPAEARVEAFQLPEIAPIGFSLTHLIKGLARSAAQRVKRIRAAEAASR
ncbi:MAG TPA: DUF362 domain-containing protein [bacterium]|nr:DUF362 domain-containing protein [bacterium]HPO99849.1 DUF362 domain-containing protein [bacterium]HXK92360.1 DUF362 domain-containing protein [bacterium]